ncbi:MAG: type transporter, partial [Verrucomicrobiales bacterium]|nr:type transporter [Verrucomicrobiales bacterium]
MKALIAIIKKDLKLFFNNPKAVVITLLVPIAVGTFMGSVTGGSSGKAKVNRVPVLVVSHDDGPITTEIIETIKKDPSLNAQVVGEKEARTAVNSGKVGVAVIFPKGFGQAATKAMFMPQNKPELTILSDPSKSMELGMV